MSDGEALTVEKYRQTSMKNKYISVLFDSKVIDLEGADDCGQIIRDKKWFRIEGVVLDQTEGSITLLRVVDSLPVGVSLFEIGEQNGSIYIDNPSMFDPILIDEIKPLPLHFTIKDLLEFQLHDILYCAKFNPKTAPYVQRHKHKIEKLNSKKYSTLAFMFAGIAAIGATYKYGIFTGLILASFILSEFFLFKSRSSKFG